MAKQYASGARLLPILALILLINAPLPGAPVAAAPLADDGTPAALYLPWLAKGPPPILLAAAYIDSSRSGEADEALLLWNAGQQPQPLAGWQIESNGRRAVVAADSTLTIAAGERLWCAAEAAAFRQSFGQSPGCEWAADSDADVPNLQGKISLVNGGGTLRLLDPDGVAVDVLLYGAESAPDAGWNGPPAQLYTHGVFTAQGQVWQRKRDPHSGLPIDSDRAQDWAGDLTDSVWGRQMRWPGWQGWDDGERARPLAAEASADLLLAVGPEGLYAPIAETLNDAAATIDLSIYTLDHPQLAQRLAEAAGRGVRVRVLLDGGPPGGITVLQKWCVARLVAAGGDVRYFAMAADAPSGLKRRYRYLHAKYGVVDGQVALVSTENFSQDSMPLPSSQPLGGRRGFALLTNAPPVVAGLQAIFATDWAPDRFSDLRPYAADDPKYGAPPPAYTPPPPPVYAVKEAPFAQPAAVNGAGHFVLLSAPENALRPDTGMQALIARAGAGDELALVQLYEQRHWGPGSSNPLADPNPRLEALIAAARRGATVRILLDSFFDDAGDLRSNVATADYVEAVAAAEGLDLAVRVGNPTAGGIHAKLLLARVGGETWSAIGSLNGGEISYKVNREVVLMVDDPVVYGRLLDVFQHDWALVTR